MRNLALVTIFLGAAVANAAPLNVLSYDMRNGDGQASSGSFNYWDLSYTGSGSTTTDSAPLSGGKGDLTDGYVETQNWFSVENGAGTGPYVGWRFSDPVIKFHLDASSVDSLTVFADDSDGAGGVSLPDGVTINGTFYDVDQAMAGAEPKALTFSGLGITGGEVEIELNRSNEWVFVSEVTFAGEPVPEPASLTLLGLGMAALARRKKA